MFIKRRRLSIGGITTLVRAAVRYSQLEPPIVNFDQRDSLTWTVAAECDPLSVGTDVSQGSIIQLTTVSDYTDRATMDAEDTLCDCRVGHGGIPFGFSSALDDGTWVRYLSLGTTMGLSAIPDGSIAAVDWSLQFNPTWGR